MMCVWIPLSPHFYPMCGEYDDRKKEELAGGEKAEPDTLICLLDLVSYSTPSSELSFSYTNSTGPHYLSLLETNDHKLWTMVFSFAPTAGNEYHFLTTMTHITLNLSPQCSALVNLSCLESLWCPKSFFCMRINALSFVYNFRFSIFSHFTILALHSRVRICLKNTASSSPFFKGVYNISRPLLQRFL